jgi:hypothetical protein
MIEEAKSFEHDLAPAGAVILGQGSRQRVHSDQIVMPHETQQHLEEFVDQELSEMIQVRAKDASASTCSVSSDGSISIKHGKKAEVILSSRSNSPMSCHAEMRQILAHDLVLKNENEDPESHLLVEQTYQGLGDEQIVIDSLPCYISADQTKFFVMIGAEVEKFTKVTLFNLVNTAEEVSPACQNLIFILKKSQSESNYAKFAQTFSVIDAESMPEAEMKKLVRPSMFSEVSKDYGFFELAI